MKVQGAIATLGLASMPSGVGCSDSDGSTSTGKGDVAVFCEKHAGTCTSIDSDTGQPRTTAEFLDIFQGVTLSPGCVSTVQEATCVELDDEAPCSSHAFRRSGCA